MKNQLIQFPIAVILILLSTSVQSFSQVPDDVNGRMWRLAKVWGFAKYYHPNNCNVDWNNMLLKAIDSTLVSSSNASFNETVSDMLSEAGVVPHEPDPLIIEAHININAHFDWIEDPQFSHFVRSALDSILVNFRPRVNCLIKMNDYSDPDYSGYLTFANDNLFDISSFSYSVESHRLAALFYYWNIINYFHPDKALMDQDWDTTLFQFIPLIRDAKNDSEFHVRFLNLVTYIDDTHGFTFSPLITAYFDNIYPLLRLHYIDNQTVVTKKGSSMTDIAIGDILQKVDGIDIQVFRDSLAQYITGSNESAVQRDLHSAMLRGDVGPIMLEMENSSGSIYTTTVTRNITENAYYNWTISDPYPAWEITECGYGYVNMGKLLSSQIQQMYNELKNTPAIIFDVRNYPNGTINNLISYLFEGPITYALFTTPQPEYPGWYNWVDNKPQTGTFFNSNPYNGKVIILVNATTQSHGEYTVMGLQQHPHAYTIGSQTAGADGNVSNLWLPGSLRTTFTSLGIYYPDSITAQRVGVRIDSVVEPSIENIRTGKDGVLLAAFECLTSSTQESFQLLPINIHPNPAETKFYITNETAMAGNINIEAYNQLGQKVFNRNIHSEELNHQPIDVSGWINGIYFINLRNEDGIFASEKVIVQH